MNKPLWIPFIAALGTMILLYIFGYVLKIDFLKFRWSPSYTEISLLPILAGIIVGFITKRILKLTT